MPWAGFTISRDGARPHALAMNTALLTAANDEFDGLLTLSTAAFTAGSFGGECFRAICRNTGASWHHRTLKHYYCEECAADINLACKVKGEPPACMRQGTGLSRAY